MKTTIAVGGMILAVGLALLTVQPATANNMAVTNVTLVNQDANAKTVEVKFDLKWDNSWRGPCEDPAYTNWDAAWVFLKFQVPGSNKWEHALLAPQDTSHTKAPGSTINVGTNGANGIGVFVYSSGPNTGDVNYAGTRLLWNYGANGYNFAAGASLTVSVQAVEMVYVPQGAFKVGSGGTANGELCEGGGVSNAFAITSAGPIPCSNLVGCLWGASTLGANSMGGNGTISSNFPNGYNAFYCMKYEITQGQYTDFLNKLTPAQTNARYYASSANRYTIGFNGVVYTNAAPDRACNFLSWADGCAYAAWAGLRPMTELEFEKACRGPAAAVSNEYAWGSTVITQLTAESVSPAPGSGAETVSTLAGANCLYGNGAIQGPTRVGIFATATSTRAQAGASYWGIMELSGNLWERPVSIGSVNGRAFTGSNGSGVLSADGKATNTDWWTDASASDASGGGFRGGGWIGAAGGARVSARSSAADVIATRFQDRGGRVVRAAPSGVGP